MFHCRFDAYAHQLVEVFRAIGKWNADSAVIDFSVSEIQYHPSFVFRHKFRDRNVWGDGESNSHFKSRLRQKQMSWQLQKFGTAISLSSRKKESANSQSYFAHSVLSSVHLSLILSEK
jgi:hypothetical protein